MRKRFFVKQRDISDCGAACLASVFAFYKYYIPVSQIRQVAGTDSRGTNIAGLIAAAEKNEFQVKAGKTSVDQLVAIPLPAIVHLILASGLHHFVVLYAVNKKSVTIMDPAIGKTVTKSLQLFLAEWTGVTLLMMPGVGFQQGNQKISVYQRFWLLINPYRSVFIQALIGAIVYTILGLSTSIFVQKLVDDVLVDQNFRLLHVLGIIMLGILLFQLVIGGFRSIISLQVGQKIDARLILGYYRHLLQLPQRFFDSMQVGEIISRVNDAMKIRYFINEVSLNIIVNTCIVVLTFCMMIAYHFKLALIAMLMIPVYIFLYLLTNWINKKWQRILMEKGAHLESQIVEGLNTSATIKRFSLEQFFFEKTEKKFIQLIKSSYSSSIKNIYLGTFTEFVSKLFIIVILWAGSYMVLLHQLSVGTLLSFYTLIGYFSGPIMSLIGSSKNIQEALIAADRLFEIIDLEQESNSEQHLELTRDLLEDIHFREVFFAYGTRVTALENISFCIKKGFFTGITGESGSGKSTLSLLMQKIHPVSSGHIFIGNIDIKDIAKDSLRSAISVVPQHTQLISGTILENICIGEAFPNLPRVYQLIKLLGMDTFLASLPDGLQTNLSENGHNLSGGQRQKIAIARALYREPAILILDEATASLDLVSEQQIMNALHSFHEQGNTVIIIAHRLSIIKQCDTIIVLQKGKIVESGTHEELLNRKEAYAMLWHEAGVL